MKAFELGKIYSSNGISIILDEKIKENFYNGRRSFHGQEFTSGCIQTDVTDDIEFYSEDGGGCIITADETMTNKERFYLFEKHMRPYGEYFEYVRRAKNFYLDKSFEDEVEYFVITGEHQIATDGLEKFGDILQRRINYFEKYFSNIEQNAEYVASKKLYEKYCKNA